MGKFHKEIKNKEINNILNKKLKKDWITFIRRFYPKRLTVHSGYTFFCQYVCSLGIEPTTFCAANAMLYHWATGTGDRNRIGFRMIINRRWSRSTPQSLTVIITSSLVDILLHNVTQFWCCFMSDDRVRLHVEASVVSVSSSLVFFLEILYRRCVLAHPTIRAGFTHRHSRHVPMLARPGGPKPNEEI